MPTNEEITKPVRMFYDALNRNDLNGMLGTLAERFEFIDIPMGTSFGDEPDFKAYFGNWMKAFPHGKGEIQHVISSGDEVVVEVLGSAKHEGPFSTPKGLIQPTGKTVEIHFCQIFSVTHGKIAEVRSYYDALSFLRELKVEFPKAA